jgi:hypothetical protein
MSRLFLDNVFKSITAAGEASTRLEKHLAAGNVQEIVEDFRRLYFNVSYIDHVAARRRLKIFQAKTDNEFPEVARLMQIAYESDDFESVNSSIEQAVENNNYNLAIKILDELLKKCGQDSIIRYKMNESYYRSLLLSFLLGAGIKVSSERHTNLGRGDLVVEHNNLTYVMELKVVEKAKNAEAAAKTAMAQIMEKGYAEQFCDPIILALAFSDEKRNIAAGYHARGKSFHKIDVGLRYEKVREAFMKKEEPKACKKTSGKRRSKI